ncbi:uncharacterized protein DUF1127 [Aliiruegeria haliotis]|uniref:Uncharacterized protein DUF1127 n=1 Tax=Aliiruegeria haliotis TaxID=1280846 RepID=A0A2T0RR02_9RHOB|nr:DUF1127 domain-containing protein [Aliiruegeria haliotis]PRY23598.1 uncharacterized protein DUF1127 [Aliiruegeria haliotis]
MSAHSINTPLLGAMRHEGFFGQLTGMMALHKQRRDLAKLDDRALSDIGVSRYQAEIEASRPAWDVPQHWMS